jgi:hypothetical protein
MRLRSIVLVLAIVVVSASSSLRAGTSAAQRATDARQQSRSTPDLNPSAILETYCAGCHNGVMHSPSGAILDRFDLAAIAENPGLWARAYRQLQAGTMPPVGATRPDRQGYGVLLASIEAGLDAAAPRSADANSQEIAARLAGLVWNSAPDAALLRAAQNNELAHPAVLEQQVQRLLADDRAESFVSRFFFPWLGLDQLDKAEPDPKYFPDYQASLRTSMLRETELFVRSQLRDDRDPVELWSADYTFLNEQLARHYGVPGISGSEFRRASSSPERTGLLGQGSILMATSRHGQDQRFTSPAARSTWLRSHFLGAAAPQPFPGAQPVKPGLPTTPQVRALPAEPCGHCHRNFFPLGYALENFDTIGRWRTDDQEGPVDASGAYVDGTPANGIVGLRTVLLQYPEAFRTTITEKLLAYSADKPANRWTVTPGTLVRARRVLGGSRPARWSSIIAAVVRTKPENAD